ncbi:MAG: LysR family transcriptional regulator [Thiotrichales bacterium]|nr:LysR family transcriptional regulator [Thiotrichales bacterium]
MQIEQLEIFVEVVQLGSFAAVAERRQLNATSVSRSVQMLEKTLGLPLLQRSTRKLALTEAGALYFAQLPAILQQLASARQRALDIKQQLQGTLRVTVPIGLADAQLVALIPEFRQQHPQLALELLITDECLDLEQQKIDLGIRIGRIEQNNWVAKPLKRLRFIACASPKFLQNHRIHQPQDLSRTPCLNFIPKKDAWRWCFVDAKQIRHEVGVQQTLLVTNERAAKQLCIAGEGVALLPDWLVTEALQTGDLQMILPDYQAGYLQADEQIWCIYPNRDYVPAKTRAFLNFITEKMGER